MKSDLYDIFISHSWRYHDDWIKMGELFDQAEDIHWRNFSVPWHDPAMNPNSEVGGNFIRNWLESQIIPVHGFILLNSVYEQKSSRKWVEMEVEMARKHQKPIVSVPTFGEETVSPEVREMSDNVASWDCREIIDVFNSLQS